MTNIVSKYYSDQTHVPLPRDVFVSECLPCKQNGQMRWAKIEWLIATSDRHDLFYRIWLCSRHLDVWLDGADDDPNLEPSVVIWLYEDRILR